MGSFFQLITLKNLLVTAHRKRLFILVLVFIGVILGVDEHIIAVLDHLPLVPNLIKLVVFALTAYLFTSAIRILTVSRYRKRHGLETEENDNFTIGASTLVGTVTTILTIVYFFAVFEIEFYTFLTSIALFSVALATVFKDSIQNFLQGLFLLFTANYRVGDYIEMNNQPRGRITDITLSKTKLHLANGSHLFISNNTLNGSAVVNLTDAPYALVTLQLTIPQSVDMNTFKTELFKLCHDRIPLQFNEMRSYVMTTDGSKADERTVECGIAVSDYSFQVERTVKDLVHSNLSTLAPKKKTRKKKS